MILPVNDKDKNKKNTDDYGEKLLFFKSNTIKNKNDV